MHTLLFLAQETAAVDGPGEVSVVRMAIALLAIVVGAVSGYKLYAKAGQPGWACLVPVYNLLVMLRIVDLPWWTLLLMLIPGVNLVASLVVSFRLAKAFGQGMAGFLALVLVPFLMVPALAFGGARYTKPS